MSDFKFDSLIINGKADSKTDSKAIFESYIESQAQLEQLPNKFKHDKNLVHLNLFKEVHFQKSNNLLFRKSGSSKDALVNFWLSKVKNLAYLYCDFNKLPGFTGLSETELTSIAKGNTDPRYIRNLEKDLSEKGVILIVEPAVAGLKLDGAVFKLDSGHPVVAMSLRYKRLDNFWFTLMHELSHIALHYDQLDSYIIDDLDSKSEELIELEADKLALNSLIPRNIWRTCAARRDLKAESVIRFAEQNNVHPAIVAGRIQHEINDYKKLSSLTNGFDTREILFSE
jgi:HTH-type transcriptional regulator/antitoxin HigA